MLSNKTCTFFSSFVIKLVLTSLEIIVIIMCILEKLFLQVRSIPVQNVLNSNPYILMYEMETDCKKPLPTPKKLTVSNGFKDHINGNTTFFCGRYF